MDTAAAHGDLPGAHDTSKAQGPEFGLGSWALEGAAEIVPSRRGGGQRLDAARHVATGAIASLLVEKAATQAFRFKAKLPSRVPQAPPCPPAEPPALAASPPHCSSRRLKAVAAGVLALAWQRRRVAFAAMSVLRSMRSGATAGGSAASNTTFLADLSNALNLRALGLGSQESACGSKGKGKGREVKGKGKGKAPPPPKSKGPPPALTPRQAAKQADLSAGSSTKAYDTPFGRRMHLVKPSYEEPMGDTVFGQLERRPSRINSDLMTEIFAGESPVAVKATKSGVTKASGAKVFDTSRATNIGIALSRLRIAPTEICRIVNTLDVEAKSLDIDDMEIVASALPTAEEVNRLMKYKDKAEELRDVEQKVLALCHISTARLKVMRIGLSHATTHANLLSRTKALQEAAQEVRSSSPLREMLGIMLQIGNFINHGVAEPSAGTARGFAIESLHVLGSFKTGQVSALHFLCLTAQASDSEFLQSLKDSLPHVPGAARDKTAGIEADIKGFGEDVKFVDTWLGQLPEEAEGRERVEKLANDLRTQSSELKDNLAMALQTSHDMQAFFAVSDSAKHFPPPEQFFGHIADFLRQFQSAWHEIKAKRGVWRKYTKAAQSDASDAQATGIPGAEASAAQQRVEQIDSAAAPEIMCEAVALTSTDTAEDCPASSSTPANTVGTADMASAAPPSRVEPPVTEQPKGSNSSQACQGGQQIAEQWTREAKVSSSSDAKEVGGFWRQLSEGPIVKRRQSLFRQLSSPEAGHSIRRRRGGHAMHRECSDKPVDLEGPALVHFHAMDLDDSDTELDSSSGYSDFIHDFEAMEKLTGSEETATPNPPYFEVSIAQPDEQQARTPRPGQPQGSRPPPLPSRSPRSTLQTLFKSWPLSSVSPKRQTRLRPS